MFKSIVIEGGDGVGKTTIARDLAKLINLGTKDHGYESCCVSFPSNSITGFRDFFLSQSSGKPSINKAKVRWVASPESKISPLTNMLMIVADFSHSYRALQSSTDIEAVRKRGNQPLIIFDREVLTTMVYQVMYPMFGELDDREAADKKSKLTSILKILVDAIQIHNHNLLVHIGPRDGVCRMTKADAFDNFDQSRIQSMFCSLVEAITSKTDSNTRFLDNSVELDWLRNRYDNKITIESFSKQSTKLAEDVLATFLDRC